VKILAIDTATERCSVALRIDGHVLVRTVDTPRGHAELVLPMVQTVLSEAGIALGAVDAIAYGRGPGAFTGVRIAIGVVQGLAYGADLPTVGISDLAAVAQQFAEPGARLLVCMDARMQEVYWGRFEVHDSGCVAPTSQERVDRPNAVSAEAASVGVGTGFRAYPALAELLPGGRIEADALPCAREIALLGEAEFRAGRTQPAELAQPVYLRDQVVSVKAT
jgi:tRNA threonylcarbamoyladenosine biosynthesis protein TsaB